MRLAIYIRALGWVGSCALVLLIAPEAMGQTTQAAGKQTADTDGAAAVPMDQQVLGWGGKRDEIASHGLSLVGAATVDYSQNVMGGRDTEAHLFRGLLDVRLNLDTQKAFGWAGGTASVDFQQHDGQNGSRSVGDVQVFDNVEASRRTEVAELWYQQVLWDEKLRVKAGKVDANTEFAAGSCTGSFLNSPFGHLATITGLPTYPDGALCLNVFLNPVKWFYVGGGIYDGSGASGTRTGSYGPARIFRSGASVFLIGETGVKWALADEMLPGRLAMGGAYHTGEFARFDGGMQRGSAAEYAILEQKIWQKAGEEKGSGNGVFAFAEYGHADGRVNATADNLLGGVTWVGPYEKKDVDSLGLGVTSVRLSEEPGAGFTHRSETAIEGYYNYQVTSYLSVRPDVQYIFNPGGKREVGDALVLTLRVVFAF